MSFIEFGSSISLRIIMTYCVQTKLNSPRNIPELTSRPSEYQARLKDAKMALLHRRKRPSSKLELDFEQHDRPWQGSTDVQSGFWRPRLLRQTQVVCLYPGM